jgi:hypothetical protein
MVIMTNLEFEARCIISILYGYLINEINLGYDRYQGSGAGDFATPCLHVAKPQVSYESRCHFPHVHVDANLVTLAITTPS